MIALDPLKHFLGQPCPHKHLYRNTDKCLRYLRNNNCVRCNVKRAAEWSKAKHKSNKTPLSCPYPKPLEFDSNKCILSGICKRNHEVCNGLSLRYINDGNCVSCRLEYGKGWRETKKEYIGEHGKKYYRANKEKIRSTANAKYKNNPVHRAKMLAQKQSYRLNNPQKVKDYEYAYSRSPQGKAVARKSEHKRRALELKAHHYPWTAKEIERRLADFDNECAYCGRSDRPLNLDHFLSIESGGANCLGNLVPCCRPCNSSKSNREPKAWYEKHPAYSKKRWKRILAILGLSKVDHRQMPLF